MKNENKLFKTKRGKEYGIFTMITTIDNMVSDDGKIKDKEKIKNNTLIIKDKLKRELLMNKIFIKELKGIEDVDKLSNHTLITICSNPYYEQAVIKNLMPFPVNMGNPENTKWLDKVDYYLALHMLYFKEFNKVLGNIKEANYSYREVCEAAEIILEYYDVENPKSAVLDKNDYIYYYPKKDLIEGADKDVHDYEIGLTLKALKMSDTPEGISKEIGLKLRDVKNLLSEVIKYDLLGSKDKATKILKKLMDYEKSQLIEENASDMTIPQ